MPRRPRRVSRVTLISTSILRNSRPPRRPPGDQYTFLRACWRPTRRSPGPGSRCAGYKTTTAATWRTTPSRPGWTCTASPRRARPRPSTRCTWARPLLYVEGPWPSRPSRGASPTAASYARASARPLGRSAARPSSSFRDADRDAPRPADVERSTRRRKKPFPRSFRWHTRVGASAPPRGPRFRANARNGARRPGGRRGPAPARRPARHRCARRSMTEALGGLPATHFLAKCPVRGAV